MSPRSLLASLLMTAAVTAGASAQVADTVARQAEHRVRRIAQDAGRTDARAGEQAGAVEPCDGCPRRRPLVAVAEVAGVNLFYNLVNRLLPTEFGDVFRVGWDTWKENIGRGFTWDNDAFVINQFGHPYQGGNYFTAGRANGLSYWESIPLVALGSVMWEWFGESNAPAWNDFINTTMGGAAFGETLHRMAWLVRDARQTGRSRLWREIGATLLDPVGGANRFARREALRPGQTPDIFRPDRAVAEFQFGTSWKEGDLRTAGSAPRHAFGSFALEYGAIERGPTRAPFDAFTLSVRVGGGALVSAASIRGRLASRPLGRATAASHQALLVQEYGFRETPGFLFGEQTILAGVADRFQLSPGVSLATTALGGAVVMGTVDSPTAPKADRAFDYGPGLSASASAELAVRGVPVLGVKAGIWWLHTVTRTPASHLLSAVRIDGRIPVTRAVHLLVEAERAARTTRSETGFERRESYPELRAGLSWRFGR